MRLTRLPFAALLIITGCASPSQEPTPEPLPSESDNVYNDLRSMALSASVPGASPSGALMELGLGDATATLVRDRGRRYESLPQQRRRGSSARESTTRCAKCPPGSSARLAGWPHEWRRRPHDRFRPRDTSVSTCCLTARSAPLRPRNPYWRAARIRSRLCTPPDKTF